MGKATKEAGAGKGKAAKPESKQALAKTRGKRKASEEQNAGVELPGQASPSPLKPSKATTPKKKAKTEDAAAPKASPVKAPKASKQASARASKKVLEEGDLLPSVVMRRNDGEQVNIQDLAKDSGLIVFMYPRANTSGCTKQAQGFKARYQELKDAGFEVYGLSFDNPTAQTKWKTKLDLPYSLLTDDSGDFLKAVGAFGPPRRVIRSHIVAAKGGKVLSSIVKISPEPSVKAATATALSNKQ